MIDPEERLSRLLESVNEWLKFAETKNGALAAVAGLAAAALLDYLKDLKSPSTFESWSLGVSGLLFIVALVLALLSFFPRTDPNKYLLEKGAPTTSATNVFYFGHLASMRGEQLALEILKLMGVVNRKPTLIERQIAEQVVVNSRIAQHKLKLFSFATRVILAGIVLSTVAIFASRTILATDDNTATKTEFIATPIIAPVASPVSQVRDLTTHLEIDAGQIRIQLARLSILFVGKRI